MKHIDYEHLLLIRSALECYIEGLEDPVEYLYAQMNSFHFKVNRRLGSDKQSIVRKIVINRAWADPDGRKDLLTLAVLCHYRWQCVEIARGVWIVATADEIRKRNANLRERFRCAASAESGMSEN